MNTIQIGKLWPRLPEDKKNKDLNLPAYFRTIAGNPRFSHEDIGRMIRCIVFNSEAFVTPLIEIDVKNLMHHQYVKETTRAKVARFRARESGDNSEENKKRKPGRPRNVESSSKKMYCPVSKKKFAEDYGPGGHSEQNRWSGGWKRVDVDRDGANDIRPVARPSCSFGPIRSVKDSGKSEGLSSGTEYSDEDLIRKMARYSSSKKIRKTVDASE